MGTRIDFDEALLNKEETKRRLAAGEQLDVYMDGRPFTYLRAPEDVDHLEPRRGNPTAAVQAGEMDSGLVVTQELIARARRGPRHRHLESLARPWTGLAEWLEENRQYFRSLRDDDAASRRGASGR